MQIQLRIENIEEEEHILRDLNVVSSDSSLVCLKPSLSISLWIMDYYFTNKSMEMKNVIGSHDMFSIYQMIQSSSSSSSSIEFFQLCKNKLNQIKTDPILDNYNNYLNRCGLVDIIDLFHQCQLESFINTIILSIDNIKNHIDRLFFDYLVELSSSYCIYDAETKLTTTETKRNPFKLIGNENQYNEQTTSKIYMKHTLCTYLSLLLDTRNEHALIHCLVTSARRGIERATIVKLKRLANLSKNECLTINQILLSFIQRKELISSLEQDKLNVDDESCQILDQYYIGIKEFFEFIKQLQMIIEENEHLKFESTATLRQILELISKHLHEDLSFDRYDLLIKEIVEELCQCFQTTLPLMNCSSSIQSSVSSGSSLASQHFLRSIAYVCAKQTIDLPIVTVNNNPSTGLPKASHSPVEEDENDQREELSIQSRYRLCKSHRSLDLSTIHETSFDSDSMPNHSTTHSDKPQPTVKRQPLGEMDVNSFINEERQIENEKTSDQNCFVLTLASDGDKENLPMSTKKRSIISTNVEPPCKKHKKTNVVIGQKMITNFFESSS